MTQPNETLENNRHELDITDLIRVYIRKWWLLGLIALIAAVMVFFVIRYKNNSSCQIRVNFELKYPGYTTGLYPDGNEFNYQEIISEEAINMAIASDNAFSSYTASGIAGNIVIETVTSTDPSVISGKYTFTINISYFGGVENAEKFSEALIKVAGDNIIASLDSVKYELYTDAYNKANTYALKLENLQKQKDYMLSCYNEWTEAYGQQFTVDGVLLTDYYQSVNQIFSSEVYAAFTNEYERKQYVLEATEEEKENCRTQIELLQEDNEDTKKKIQQLEEKLAALREGETTGKLGASSGESETYFYTQIATYTEHLVDIERTITRYETKLANMEETSEAAKDFNERLDGIRDSLVQQAEILKNTVAPAVYKEKLTAALDTSSLQLVGQKNAKLYAIMAFVLVYFLVGFGVFVLSENKNIRKKSKSEEK